jgi:hypothetical protein
MLCNQDLNLNTLFKLKLVFSFSNKESHDVPYLSWSLVCDTLSSCIVDRRLTSHFGHLYIVEKR